MGVGRQIIVKVGGFEKSLAELGAWPPSDAKGGAINEPTTGDNGLCVVTLPPDVLRPNSVNWIELHQKSATVLYAPLLPAVMEPYIAPLWSETEDQHNPPMPQDW